MFKSGIDLHRIQDIFVSALKTDVLHKWRLILNNNTFSASLASHLCFKTKDFSQECEAKDV